MKTWEIKDSVTFTKTITDSDNQLFGEISGDDNPVHFNKERMANTFFKKPIGNGFQMLSLIGSAIVKLFVTDETLVIILEQQSSFSSPVYIGDILNITITIDKILQRNQYLVQGIIKNQNNEIVVSAKSKIKVLEA